MLLCFSSLPVSLLIPALRGLSQNCGSDFLSPPPRNEHFVDLAKNFTTPESKGLWYIAGSLFRCLLESSRLLNI